MYPNKYPFNEGINYLEISEYVFLEFEPAGDADAGYAAEHDGDGTGYGTWLEHAHQPNQHGSAKPPSATAVATRPCATNASNAADEQF